MSRPLKHWYIKGLKVLLWILGFVVLAAILYVGGLTLRYYRNIQLDIPSEIQGKITYGAIPEARSVKETLAYQAADDPVLGDPQAPLQIVEFADFECPFSREESFVIREIAARFPDKIHFVYRDFPLEEIHPRAFAAAEAANCAADQGKFWAMHDKLYQNAQQLRDIDIKTYALEIGLNIVQFNECYDGHKYKDEIEADRADGVAAGVIGTPTFFINGKKVAGAIPLELWEQLIARVR